MNVALFASAFYPSLGGVEELVRQLAHAYRRRGMGVLVVTNRWPADLPAQEDFEGIPLYRLPMRAPVGDLKARVKYALTHAGIRNEMLAILRKHETDLIHVQCVSGNGYYALQARHALKLPLIVTAQGEFTMDATRVFERSAFLRDVLRDLLTEADFITGCSNDTVAEIERFYGKPFGSRASTVYNGINLRDFADWEPYSHPKPYILAIGRQVVQKGFDVLLKAYAQAALPDYDLLLAGDGEQHSSLEELIQTLGLEGRAHLVGRADRKKAVALFQSCAFFVLPSRHEPFGIVNLEAMACGKAVLATRVGGVPELVLDEQTGILVPGDDVNALAAGLQRLAADPALYTRLGNAGKERAAAFDWEKIADTYCALYAGVQHGNAAKNK